MIEVQQRIVSPQFQQLRNLIRKKICFILGWAGKTINAHGYLSWGNMPFADVDCKIGPTQPRSPCEHPLTDHPHRPGSHQQSCCPLSNFQKLNFVTHIAQISYLKNMRSPSKTQPITMKELDRTRIQRAESSPKTKRSWRTQRARRAQRVLSTECLCP